MGERGELRIYLGAAPGVGKIGRRQLLTEVWGPASTGDTSSLRLYLNRLRRKLEPDPSRPRHLLTEPGLGYRFEP